MWRGDGSVSREHSDVAAQCATISAMPCTGPHGAFDTSRCHCRPDVVSSCTSSAAASCSRPAKSTASSMDSPAPAPDSVLSHGTRRQSVPLFRHRCTKETTSRSELSRCRCAGCVRVRSNSIATSMPRPTQAPKRSKEMTLVFLFIARRRGGLQRRRDRGFAQR